jgi:hypothetical protein
MGTAAVERASCVPHQGFGRCLARWHAALHLILDLWLCVVVFQVVCRRRQQARRERVVSWGVFVYRCAGVRSVQMCRCAESECV